MLIGGGLFGVAALEYPSLRGAFDHRSLELSARERFDAALGSLGDTASGVVHVGHSTHLIQLGGFRLLTDPWFYDPAFGALRHEPAPATSAEAVGPLDAIVVSHDHADHADPKALDRLDKSATVLTATSELAAKIRRLGYQTVEVLTPWQDWTADKVVISATPAVHDVPEIGFVIRDAARSLYFAGDSALFDGMREIRQRYAPQTALLPIDGTQIRWEPLQVMGPTQALQAAELLGVRTVLPTHHQAVFSDPLAEHVITKAPREPETTFRQLLAAKRPNIVYRSPAAGELIALDEPSAAL